MTPPTAADGTRRRAECPVCGRPFMVRADGKLRKHFVTEYTRDRDYCWTTEEPCAGSYVDCTGDGVAT